MNESAGLIDVSPFYRMDPTRRSNEKGAALIVVLMFLWLLSLLVIESHQNTMMHSKATFNGLIHGRTKAIAKNVCSESTKVLQQSITNIGETVEPLEEILKQLGLKANGKGHSSNEYEFITRSEPPYQGRSIVRVEPPIFKLKSIGQFLGYQSHGRPGSGSQSDISQFNLSQYQAIQYYVIHCEGFHEKYPHDVASFHREFSMAF